MDESSDPPTPICGALHGATAPRATLNKSLAARSSLFWAVGGVANPRHSWAMAVVCALQPIPNQGAHTREDLFSIAQALNGHKIPVSQTVLAEAGGLCVVARTTPCPHGLPRRCRPASGSPPGRQTNRKQSEAVDRLSGEVGVRRGSRWAQHGPGRRQRAGLSLCSSSAKRWCTRRSTHQVPSASSGSASPVTRSGDSGRPAAFSALAP